MFKRITLLASAVVLATIPCFAGSARVSNGWFRVLPNHLPAAGYFSVRNTGTFPLVLTGAQSPACSMLTLHMSHNMGGMTHMMPVESVEVPAGGTVDFAPGGYHLMCMNPDFVPGTSVAVTLRFKNGEVVESNFQAMDATGH